MNKKYFKFRFILILAFLVIQNYSLYSELPEELRKEVIVFIRPGYLIFPEQESSPMPLNNVVVNSTELSNAFSNYGVQTIQKAFPDFDDDDTIRISETGYEFTIPQFSRIFRLQLSNETMTDSLIILLSQIPDVVAYAEKNTFAQISGEKIPDDHWFFEQWHFEPPLIL